MLTFNETFEVEPDEKTDDCPYDALTLYPRGYTALHFGDRLCGMSRPKPLLISTSWIMVIFESDISTAMKGFQMNWRTITAAEEQILTKNPKPSAPVPPPKVFGVDACSTQQGTIINDHYGFLNSPGFGNSPSYPSSTFCRWIIRPGTDEGELASNYTRMEFRFLDFSVQGSKLCKGDFVLIKYKDKEDKLQWHRFCNGANPPPFEDSIDIKTTTGAEVVFRSDSWLEERGFNLAFRTVKNGEKIKASPRFPDSDKDTIAEICGVSQAYAPAASTYLASSPFLINGPRYSQLGDFPWMVRLLFENKHRCAGTMVADRWIVTAANCFNGDYRTMKGWTVKLANGADASPIENIYLHKDFGKVPGNPHEFNVAVVKLQPGGKPVSMPLCLPSRNTRRFDRCYVIGWHVSKSGRQEQLKYYHVPISNSEMCRYRSIMYEEYLTKNMLCAGYEFGTQQQCHCEFFFSFFKTVSNGFVFETFSYARYGQCLDMFRRSKMGIAWDFIVWQRLLWNKSPRCLYPHVFDS